LSYLNVSLSQAGAALKRVKTEWSAAFKNMPGDVSFVKEIALRAKRRWPPVRVVTPQHTTKLYEPPRATTKLYEGGGLNSRLV
jgi:hypothetical protein